MAFFLKKRRKGSYSKANQSKKADISISVEQIIGLVLAIGAIIVLVALIFIAANIILSKPQQGSSESLKNLNEAINTLLRIPNNAECYIPVYVDKDNAIVGYEAGDARPVETCAIPEAIDRPKECQKLACICLCPRGWGDLSHDSCIKNKGCYAYPKEKLTSITSEDENGKQQSLVFYGLNCALFENKVEEIGVKNVMLTKNGTTLDIRRVNNTMGADPCSALKYQ